MKNYRTWVACALAVLASACMQKYEAQKQGGVLPRDVDAIASDKPPISSAEPPPPPIAAAEQPMPPAPRAPPPSPAPVHAKPPASAVSSGIASTTSGGRTLANDADQLSNKAGNVVKRFKHGAKKQTPAVSAGAEATDHAASSSSQVASQVVAPKAPEFQKVKAELAADPVITTPGNPGDLRVWVGDRSAQANFPTDMARASADIVTSLRPSTVKITPNAPAFQTTPESLCSKFDPAGTTVHFELVPNLERAGKFRVGAGVWLYDSSDCTGTPSPKDAPDLEVEVVVKVVPDDMLKTLREGISKFWAELVGLLVALLLFFARNLLKKMFGFDGK